MDERRHLRILFFVDRGGVLRQFASVLRELVERGHEVRVLVREPLGPKHRRLIEVLFAGSASPSIEPAPRRAPWDGWRPVAWAVRALGDLARYAHPRYAGAAGLRSRMSDETLGGLAGLRELEPVGRALALRLARRLATESDAELSERVIRQAARLDAAIPPSRRITRALRELAPDVVLATALMKPASPQVEYLKSARALGVPCGISVASWDNLTNKGLLKFVPERVFVWNDVQRREAVELHGIPSDRVLTTGSQRFDPWFERTPSVSRGEFVRRAGLDPAEPFVLFLGSSPFVTNHSRVEVEFVRRWLSVLRSSPDERIRRLGVMVRPHPVGGSWRDVTLDDFPNAVVWPPDSRRPVGEAEQNGFFDSIAWSAAVVGINTTAMIEAAVVGKSVLTVLAPEFGQESTLHFHYLLSENGGFLHVASSLEEHAEQLAAVLAEEAADAERRRAFVASFVRPNGVHRPATPIYADAVEELATMPVRRTDPAPRGLRALLTVEAALSSLCILVVSGRRLRGSYPVRLRRMFSVGTSAAASRISAAVAACGSPLRRSSARSRPSDS